MKTCTMLAYYVGYDSEGRMICDGNHCCRLETSDDFFEASDYARNTINFLISDNKDKYPSLSRIILKHTQMM